MELPTREWLANDNTGLFRASEGSKYTLVCVDTVSGLTQAASWCQGNQLPTSRELVGLSHMHEYSNPTDGDQGSHLKGRDVQD